MSGSGLGLSADWRLIAVLALSAAIGSLGVGCSEESSPSTGGSSENANTDEDEDEDEDDATDEEEDDSPPAKTDSGARADGSTRDSGTGSKPPDSGTSKPADSGSGQAGGGSSAFCEAMAVVKTACQSCHDADGTAGSPMPLLTYEDMVADAPVTDGKKVHEVIKTRIHDNDKPMPPGGVMPAAQLAALDAWIEGGAEAGDDPTCADKGGDDEPDIEAVWPPEGSDECYELTVDNASIAAGAETHPQFVVDAPWGSDPVHVLGTRPITDNKKVLHHWILYSNGGVGGFLTGWAPGQDDSKDHALPPDVGIAFPSGPGSMRFDMHYNNLQGSGAEVDNSGVEICVTHTLRKYSAGTTMSFIGIPVVGPGAMVDTVGSCTVSIREPTFILSESPHAHKLAYWAKLEIKRGSETFTLHDSAFNFEEQTSRSLDEPFELKNGDVVTTTCRFNNTTSNLVFFGLNTDDEMCFNFAVLYPLNGFSCGGGLGGFGGGGGAAGLGGLLGGGATGLGS